MTYAPEERAEGGELILFWENGMAPVKRGQNFFFTLTKNGVGNFVFTDPAGAYKIPFHFSSDLNRDNVKPEDLRSFRVAFPQFEEQPMQYGKATLEVNNTEYHFELAENINGNSNLQLCV